MGEILWDYRYIDYSESPQLAYAEEKN